MKTTKTMTAAKKAELIAKGKKIAAAPKTMKKTTKKTATKSASVKAEPKIAQKVAAKNTANADFSPEAKITPLVSENPRREGTKAHDWFQLYFRKGITVAKYLAAGGDRGYLRNDAGKRGLIKLVA